MSRWIVCEDVAVACAVGDEESLTGMRSLYFWRIRSASALRFSKGCSSLNLDLILFDGSGRFRKGVGFRSRARPCGCLSMGGDDRKDGGLGLES